MDTLLSPGGMYVRGVTAFVKGRAREDHNMNPKSAGIYDWQAGWDDAKRAHEKRQMAKSQKVAA